MLSNGVVDLTTLSWDGEEKIEIEVNVVFGKGVIRIDPDIATVYIEANVAFGQLKIVEAQSAFI